MGNQASFHFTPDTENINLIDLNLTKLPFNPPLDSKVKYLYLNGNKFSSLPENLKEVIFVDLSTNQIGPSIPNGIAKALTSYLKLKTLYLAENQLENFNSIFENFSLESFDLVQNRFIEMPDDFFTRFPILKTLYLDYNFLKIVPEEKSDSIITLSLYLNSIETINTSITHFPQLASLDLSKNQIKELPNNFSKSFPNLHDLNLSYNFISNIPELPEDQGNDNNDNFVFPKTLKELNLSNNLIEKVPNSITCLSNLTHLNISNNKIVQIPQMQESIQKLIVANNKINYIEKQTLNSMRDFNFSKNELTEFPTEIKMPQNNSISIDHNHITEIIFKSIPVKKIFSRSIVVIDISFNEIEIIPKEIFENLVDLQTFSACFNKIADIPSEISNCQKLSNLDISFNPIKKLPKLPRSILRIMASNCQLDSFEDPFCEPKQVTETSQKSDKNENQQTDTAIHLKLVDFSRNNFESFPTIPSVQILNLSQNKIKKLPTLTDQIKTLDVSMNLLESTAESMPQVISSKSIIELNLSHNKLTQMPVFQNVPILQYLELSGNPIQGKLNISEQLFLERINLSQTNISISGNNESIHEVIISKNDTKILTSSKNEPKNKSPILKKPIYVNQKVIDGKYKSGFSEILGLRTGMEDSIIVRDDLNLYAVCDGHAGPDTAKFAAIQIADLFEKGVKTKNFSYEKGKSFILNIFQQTDKNLQKVGLPDGSTICLAFVLSNEENNRKIVTAHLGDARAMIVRSDGSARELTIDHKPTTRSEFERIHNMFGRVSKDNRVDGLLAVSRSFGDFKVFGVGKEPELNEFDLDDENDKFLVIGCDGVFDMLSNDDVALILSDVSDPVEAAFTIRNAAFGCNSADNISVIVVDLLNK